jgi:hypothetical protein
VRDIRAAMNRSLPIYASTATRRGRGWSRRRRRFLRVLRPAGVAFLLAVIALLATTAERALG